MINTKTTSFENGNAMVYVLIAIALFGALTISLSRQNDGADGQDISDETRGVYINELIEYVASTQNTIDMMEATGTDLDELSFVNPTSAGFNTGLSVHKVFHPQGGGLNYQAQFNEKMSAGTPYGWYYQDKINIAWSDSSDPDVMIMAYNLTQDICEAINRGIDPTLATIPALTVELEDIFDPDNFTESSFSATNCTNCVDYTSLCVSNAAADTFGFYNIIATR